MGGADPTFVIVGASLAGATAAATLRSEGFDGRVVLIGAEEHPPYERPPLSKEYLRGERSFDEVAVRPEGWYAENGIELRLGTRVEEIRPREGDVRLAGDTTIPYDALLIATGSRNRRLDVPGVDLPGVVDLRRVGDADRIREAATSGARVVCVGMGFVGAEVAASLRTLGADVTVVEFFETTLFRVLGPEIGRVLEGIHRDHGVRMRFGQGVERFEGDARLERVVTDQGETMGADLAVVGVGTEPAMDVVAGTELDGPGGIPVGPSLAAAIPGVFAAGDVALHEHPAFGPIRVEHFDNALKMGEHVAWSMLGKTDAFDDPHWFWSDQFESTVEVAGFAPSWDRIVMRGSLEERSFCAFLLDERGVLRSTVSLDWRRDVRRSFELIRHEVAPDPAKLADPAVDLRKLLPTEVEEA